MGERLLVLKQFWLQAEINLVVASTIINLRVPQKVKLLSIWYDGEAIHVCEVCASVGRF